MSTDQYKYDVCLSFAGEQRAYVQQVAELLAGSGLRVFYDVYEQANLWGKDLYEHLDTVYRKSAKYCILFVSDVYARKVWTNHERKSAQARALNESREYVLPVRFDDTELPGIRPTVGYIDTRSTTLQQLVDLVVDKLTNLDDTEDSLEVDAAKTRIHVPVNPSEQRSLIESKPPGWEYLLFAGVLVQGRAALEPKMRDHHLRFARTVRRILRNAEAIDYINSATQSASAITGNMMKVLEAEALRWAFGAIGVPGSEGNILHLGGRFIRAYEDMFDWSADLRGTATSSELRPLFELGAQLLDVSISRVDEFIDQYSETLISALGRLERGEENIRLTMELTLDIDDGVLRRYRKELKRARRR